ncbi:MAG TPA: DNA double-strand break repair nuclease NurA [Symbiobacteriaceae bacterium]|nr:DNA double-strand break repair nuclease NurA [Symbiobacteriaceae bacterium]
MADDWVQQLQALNGRVRTLISDVTLGDKRQRRNTLQQVGRFRPLRRLGGAELENLLDGGLLVGVDGSINTFGGQFPYYVDLIRALAKPSRGEAVVVKSIHCPIPPEEEDDQETAIRNDNEVRQRMLAELEVQAAIEAVDRLQPKLILMDGPLVRFDMRAKDSFVILCEKVTRNRIALLGCIENIESKVIGSVLGDLIPPGWRNRYDRELLWDLLAYGEVLEIRTAAKGLPRPGTREAEAARANPICTWFIRSSLDPVVVGVDMLQSQLDLAGSYIDYLYTLSPADGRGIPIWLDLVDREVRLTDVELEAYTELLDPQVRRVFHSKRDARFF